MGCPDVEDPGWPLGVSEAVIRMCCCCRGQTDGEIKSEGWYLAEGWRSCEGEEAEAFPRDEALDDAGTSARRLEMLALQEEG